MSERFHPVCGCVGLTAEQIRELVRAADAVLRYGTEVAGFSDIPQRFRGRVETQREITTVDGVRGLAFTAYISCDISERTADFLLLPQSVPVLQGDVLVPGPEYLLP